MTTRLRLRRNDGNVYLERWGIETDRIGGVFIHRMTAPDPGLDLHDHPWNFSSLILWGGYSEERIDSPSAVARANWAEYTGGDRRGIPAGRRWLSIRRTRVDLAHRIVDLNRRTSWSLVVRGPRRRVWGFHTPYGFVKWTDYDTSRRGLGEDTI